MIAKVLGLLDLLCVIMMFSAPFIPHKITMVFALLLVAKGLAFAFTGDAASIIDILAGIYIGLVVYGIHHYIASAFFAVFLIQKGLLSVLAG